MRGRARSAAGARRRGRVKAGVRVAEVLGQFLDGDASDQHDAGVVVAELVDTLPAGGDIAASAAPVQRRVRESRPALTSGRLPDCLRKVAGFDMLIIGMSSGTVMLHVIRLSVQLSQGRVHGVGG